MSIEIEVGLENAPRIPVTLEEPLAPESPKGLEDPKVQRLLLAGVTVVLAVAVGLFLYYRNRETTDDAQVDGHITPIAAKISGRVAEVLVHDNEPVKAGQVLVKIDPRDYQAALDNAKAALALALSEAQSANVDVPRHARKCGQRNFQCECGIAGCGGGTSASPGGVCAGAKFGSGICKSQRGKEPRECTTGASRPGTLPAVDGQRRNFQATVRRGKSERRCYGERAKSRGRKNPASAEQYSNRQGAVKCGASASGTGASGSLVGARGHSASEYEDRGRPRKTGESGSGSRECGCRATESELHGNCRAARWRGTHKQVEAGTNCAGGARLAGGGAAAGCVGDRQLQRDALRKMRAGQKAEVHVDTYGKTFSGHLDSIAGATGAVLSLLPPENATGIT